jgi:hypothetical protein
MSTLSSIKYLLYNRHIHSTDNKKDTKKDTKQRIYTNSLMDNASSWKHTFIIYDDYYSHPRGRGTIPINIYYSPENIREYVKECAKEEILTKENIRVLKNFARIKKRSESEDSTISNDSNNSTNTVICVTDD